MKIELTPSLIAQYYEHNCEKFLFYSAVDGKTYKALKGKTRPKRKETATSLAGNEWERKLLERKKADPNAKIIDLKNDKNLSKTVSVLKSGLDKKKICYLYQAVLNTTPSFESKYLTGSNKLLTVCFGNMFPDFIRAEYDVEKDMFRLTVIDAKNAGFLKIGAEIQVAIYSKILKDIIIDKKINNCYVNENTGIVWNREKITDNCLENEFDLYDAYNEVDAFFSKTLVSFCKKLSSVNEEKLNKTLKFRISQKCEYCTNFDDCKGYCKTIKSIRLLPYINFEAQERLEKLISDKKLKDDSLNSVTKMLRDPVKSSMLTDDCSFWKNVKNNLDSYEQGLKSYYSGKLGKYDKSGVSLCFPRGQDFALYLSAQQDVNTGRMYAYSWFLKPGYGLDVYDPNFDGKFKDVRKKSEQGLYYDSYVATKASKEEFDRIDESFVNKLYSLFDKIDNYSKIKTIPYTDSGVQKSFSEPAKRLQVYVMDHYEKINIQDALFHMLSYLDPKANANLYNKTTAVLLWLQGERNIAELPEQAEECLDNPVIVLTTEISHLYSLSSPVGYSLKNMPDFFNTYCKFSDYDKDHYLGVLTNVIEGMNLINAWNISDPAKKAKALNGVAAHLRTRLIIESELVEAIQNNDERIKAMNLWPPMFSIEKQSFNDTELASLNFENKYEQLLQYQQIRSDRATGISLAIEKGSILSLEYVKGSTFKILNRDSYIGKEWFNPLLCKDDDKHRNRILLLQDRLINLNDPKNKKVYWTINPYTIKKDNTVFYRKDRDADYNFTDNGKAAFVDFTLPTKVQKSFTPKKGEKFLMFDTHIDFNGDKVQDCLRDLDDKRNRALKNKFLDPIKLAGRTADSSSFDERICSKYGKPDGLEFSDSQKIAFAHLFKRKLTVLEGPPATGKSNFIARSIITLARYYREEQGRSLKVLVTGLSHPAINNVLFKLSEMLQKENPCGIQLIKVKKKGQDNVIWPKNIKPDLDEGKVVKEFTTKPDTIQVFGATCWSVSKQKTDHCKYDLIIVDEASQYRAMDALIVFSRCKEDTRFLLVGDEKQLPSIIQGNYIKKEGKDIYGSVFHMFMTGLGDGHKDIISLDEQFRMNGILCKYSSTIYNEKYKAATPDIEKQKISLKARSSNAMLDFIMDEDYPLVFCEVSGDDQLQTEIESVTSLVAELKSNLICKKGDFWSKGCGIISPHHEYINRVKTSIANRLGLKTPNDVFIGTVDKLQGQEREVVIVSYGVSSFEKINNESEFIFSMERFNVSITRGKAKTIVFLSEVLAEPNLKTNVMKHQSPDLEKGINFIHGFTRFMKEPEPGEDLKYEEFLGGKINVWKKRLI